MLCARYPIHFSRILRSSLQRCCMCAANVHNMPPLQPNVKRTMNYTTSSLWKMAVPCNFLSGSNLRERVITELQPCRCFTGGGGMILGKNQVRENDDTNPSLFTENEARGELSVEQERELHRELQEEHMNAVAIQGLSEEFSKLELEEEILRLFKDIGVRTNCKTLKHVKRIKPGWVYCELSDRKTAQLVLSFSWKSSSKLRPSGIFVSQSLCDAYVNIFYHTRKLKQQKKISQTKVRNGIVQIRLHGSSEWTDVTHMHDLVGLTGQGDTDANHNDISSDESSTTTSLPFSTEDDQMVTAKMATGKGEEVNGVRRGINEASVAVSEKHHFSGDIDSNEVGASRFEDSDENSVVMESHKKTVKSGRGRGSRKVLNKEYAPSMVEENDLNKDISSIEAGPSTQEDKDWSATNRNSIAVDSLRVVEEKDSIRFAAISTSRDIFEGLQNDKVFDEAFEEFDNDMSHSSVPSSDPEAVMLIEEERQQYKHQQAQGMNSVVISGLPQDSDETELKKEIDRLLKATFVWERIPIESVERLAKGSVRCELKDEKWVSALIDYFCHKGSPRKSTGILMNPWLCDAYIDIKEYASQLKRLKKIKDFRVRRSRVSRISTVKIKLLKSDRWVDVTHMQDFIELGLHQDL